MKTACSALASLILIASPWTGAAAEENEADPAPSAADADVAGEDETGETEEPNADEMADQLNSQQQLQQTFTLKRTINGEVVETTKKTVTLSPGAPYRPTEAGETTLQQVQSAFDSEVLTRVEAFEEAKLDFTIADSNRDGRMTADEFADLVHSWRQTGAKDAEAPTEEIARDRQYKALLEVIDPEAAEAEYEAYAKAKFAFISGAQETIAREDYIREYLLDFDTMDADDDTLLQGEELMRFRAANRGETIEGPAFSPSQASPETGR